MNRPPTRVVLADGIVSRQREGNVEASDAAQILVAGPPVRTVFGSSPKDPIETMHSLPYLVAKYRELMPQSRLPARRLDEILATIRGLDNVNDVSQLARMLVPGR